MPSVLADPSVPLRFAASRLETYEPRNESQQAALAAARRLADREIESLVLVGPPGVGKTHLAAGVVWALYERAASRYQEHVAKYERGELDRWPMVPVTPLWANVADLIVALRTDIDRPPDDREAASRVSALRSHTGLVVLDDLGRERVSDWTAETIYALVNTRYEEMSTTLVTSNLSPDELAASPYWPAVSRLAEDGALVAVSGPDRRLER